jgi:hypothetical protein
VEVGGRNLASSTLAAAGAKTTNSTELRERLRAMNIVDLNIVPINRHALMKDIPLINLTNYSYTFDEMVKADLAPYREDRREINGHTTVKIPDPFTSRAIVRNTEEMFGKLLLRPYDEYTQREYFTFIHRLMAGATRLPLGRPKFSSDQIWNKVLLNTTYDQPHDKTVYINARSLVLDNNLEVDANPYYRSAVLSSGISNLFWKSGKTVNVSKLSDITAQALANLGEKRHETHMIRSVDWFVNLQRYLRMYIRKQLSVIDTPVVKSLRILNPSITEYLQNQERDVADAAIDGETFDHA